jgi:putative component of membrane protein insertase Oxa1/YidC/SpoIIIJ protein YidD
MNIKILNYILIGLITSLRPLLGPSPSGCCKFALGCTEFAIETLKNKNAIVAIYFITKRLISCNPFMK